MKRRLPVFSFPVAAAAVIAAAYYWLVYASTFFAPGTIGLNFDAVGTDFMVFHGAAQNYLSGHWGIVYDGERLTRYLNQAYAHWLRYPVLYRPFMYPPHFLLVLVPFGLLPFATSYAVFLAGSAALLVTAVVAASADAPTARAIALGALLCPAAALTAIEGQNVFLGAALLVAGVRLLERRPFIAGVVLAVATIKPHFAILLPIALLGARQWRSLAGMIAGGAALLLASGTLLGWNLWLTWFEKAVGGFGAVSAGAMTDKLWGSSVWDCVVVAGLPPSIATLAQAAAALFAAVAVFIAFRRTSDSYSRLAVLLPAVLLAAPQWTASDGVLLVLAGLFWLAQRRNPVSQSWPALLVLGLWFLPLLGFPILSAVGLVTPLLVAGFLCVTLTESFPPVAPASMEAARPPV